MLQLDEFETEKAIILAERDRLQEGLLQLPVVKKIYPTSANFLLVEVADANSVYSALVSKKVIVRNRHSVIKNCIRITVGTKEENNLLLTELKKISQ